MRIAAGIIRHRQLLIATDHHRIAAVSPARCHAGNDPRQFAD
ncbi:MAG TPA: hypothetical protein PKM88_01230 [bacterium]|nr:hypothetical protein [bacterium]